MHTTPLHRNLRRKLLALAISAVSVHEAEAIDFPVGVGVGCFSPDIQTALDAAQLNPGQDLVAITASAPSLSGLALTIDGHAGLLSVAGGYTDCSLTVLGGNSVLSGAGGASAPVVNITGAVDVTLQRIDLAEGDASEGGGLRFEGTGTVRLREMVVRNNTGGEGAGIWVQGPSPASTAGTRLVVGTDVSIEDNLATNGGGGLSVRDAAVRIVGPGLRIVRNRANSGAGMIVQGAATVDIASDGGSGGAVFEGNVAGSHGGAIAATDNAVVKLYTRGAQPTTLSGNEGEFGGAALSAVGNSRITAWDVIVANNIAPRATVENGGILDLVGNARVAFVRNLNAEGGAPFGAVNCAIDQRCNRFDNNRAGPESSPEGTGLAWLIINSTSAAPELVLDGALVTGNKGSSLIAGSCSYPPSCLGAVTLRNSVLVKNIVGQSLIDARSRLDLDHVTFADNVLQNGYLLRVFSGVRMHRSVVQQPIPSYIYRNMQPSGAQFDVQHNLFLTDPGIADPPSTHYVGDAGFVDRAGGDFHLQANSLAIDAAPGDAAIPRDAELNPRAVDQPRVMDIAGIADLGAYERAVTDIFANSFEGAP